MIVAVISRVAQSPIDSECDRPRIVREHVGAGLEHALAARPPQIRHPDRPPAGAPALAVGLLGEVDFGDDGELGLRCCAGCAALDGEGRAGSRARGEDFSAAQLPHPVRMTET